MLQRSATSPRYRRSLSAYGLVALTALAAALWQPAQAQPADASGGSMWGLGLGAGIERKAYRDMDDETQALPLLMYENRWVSVLGPRIDLKLPPAGPVGLRLRVRYAQDGYDAKDSAYFAGMKDRDAGVWVGLAAQWRTPFADFIAEASADAASKSKGQQFKLGVERGFNAGAFEFKPRVAAVWLDRKYVGYYYGVDAGEARLGRPAYDGDATVNMEFGLRTSYSIAPRQSLFLDLSGTAFGSGIKDSPLVERSSSSAVRLGYLYRF